MAAMPADAIGGLGMDEAAVPFLMVPAAAKTDEANPDRAKAVFLGMMKKSPFADVVLAVGPTTTFRAHKFVLAGRSAVMKAMLFEGWAETARSKISLPDDDPEVWSEILEHAYTSTWSGKASLLMVVKDYADRYGFHELAAEAAADLKERLTNEPNDVMAVAARAISMGNLQVRDLALGSAFRNVRGVLRSTEVLRLDRDGIKAFLEDDRCASSEIEVFRTMVRWGLNAMRIAEEEAGGPPADGRPAEELREAYAFLGRRVPGRRRVQDASPCGGDEPFAPEERRAAEAAALESARVSRAESGASDSSGGARGRNSVRPPHWKARRRASSGTASVAQDKAFLDFMEHDLKDLPKTEAAMRQLGKDALTGCVVQTARPSDLRDALGDVLSAVRFPLIDAVGLASDVAPSGLLTDAQLAALFLHQMRPFNLAVAEPEVAGFSNVPRKPVSKEITLTMWGAGGASGMHATGAAGGAGGYLRVRYALLPGDTLSIFVGQGGLGDGGNSAMTSVPWPNGGRGGYNYKTGAGGAATFVRSSLHGDLVICGAGGGGGGTAAHAWSSGGGGGGGTADGCMGGGGDGMMRTPMVRSLGANGNGNGGKDDSSGSGKKGEAAHGSGGYSGSSNCDGGDGGRMSMMELPTLLLDQSISATDVSPVTCPLTGLAHGSGGAVGNCNVGGHGFVLLSMFGETVREFSYNIERKPYEIAFEDL